MLEKNLKVCLLNDSFPPAIDGVANAVVNYANLIHENGGEVIVGTPKYPGVEDHCPYPVVRYRSLDTTKIVGYRAGYPFSVRTMERLESFGPNIIHSHCPVMSNILARLLRDRIDVPIVFTYHTKFDIEIARAIEGKLLQSAAARMLVDNIEACDEVWVVSRGAGENLRNLGYKGDYVVMENGVDFPKGAVEKERAAALRKELGIGQETPVYLFVGRMMWYKGIRIILEALDRYRRSGADFRMIFVGDGADREEIEALAAQLQLTDRCLFPGAVRDRELLRVYFSMADLFLFPSTFDTNGIVVREAAACGLGSVLIRGSCAAEGIEGGRTGLLIEENSESLYVLLQQVGDNRQVLRMIGENAMNEIYISWEDSVQRACERYQIVQENYRRGLTDRRFEISDELLGVIGNLCSGIAYARSLRENYKQRKEQRRQ